MYHKTKGYKAFSVFNHILLIVVALSCFLPRFTYWRSRSAKIGR